MVKKVVWFLLIELKLRKKSLQNASVQNIVH